MNAFVAMMVTVGLVGDAGVPSVYGEAGASPSHTYVEGGSYVEGGYCQGCQNGECEDDDGCGCCKYCRSTCDMPQHHAYPPVYHGSYYFRPYNYSNVLRDRDSVLQLQGDPNAPYAVGMFDDIYAAGVYEEDMGSVRVPGPFPHTTNQLPDLEEIVND